MLYANAVACRAASQRVDQFQECSATVLLQLISPRSAAQDEEGGSVPCSTRIIYHSASSRSSTADMLFCTYTFNYGNPVPITFLQIIQWIFFLVWFVFLLKLIISLTFSHFWGACSGLFTLHVYQESSRPPYWRRKRNEGTCRKMCLYAGAACGARTAKICESK